MKSMLNQTSMMGPKANPTTLVPKRWKKNSNAMITMTTTTVKPLPGSMMPANAFTPPSPSIAALMEMGGWITPSARSVVAPMIAGIYTHLP